MHHGLLALWTYATHCQDCTAPDEKRTRRMAEFETPSPHTYWIYDARRLLILILNEIFFLLLGKV